MTTRQCNVICSRCGRSYRAFSSRATIAYKLRQGNGIYCPQCVIERQREMMTRNNLDRWNRDNPIVREWQAPCGKVIVPEERKRCETFTRKGCSDYGTCLYFAARQNWPGWRLA